MMNTVVLGDWGTSRLRLYLYNDGGVEARREAPGIGMLRQPPLEALRTALGPWLNEPVVTNVLLCGMAGSRNGIAEVAYASCPASPGQWASGCGSVVDGGLHITIAPGLSCANAVSAPDVMRGEETQIFGAMRSEPTLARGRHVVVAPGTHSKWVIVEDGAVVQFHTFLTGETFALMRDHSTLTRAGEGDDGHEEGFDAGLARAQDGAGVLAHVFEARSAQILAGRQRGWAIGFLSGLLIGNEIADGLALCGKPATLTVVGDPGLTARYARALAAHDVAIAELDGDACAIAGLVALGKLLTEGV